MAKNFCITPCFKKAIDHIPTLEEFNNPRNVLTRLAWVMEKVPAQLNPMIWKKIWVAPSVWPMAILVCSVWLIPLFLSVQSGQYQYFGLFGLSNNHISVCLVWPILMFQYVWSIPMIWSFQFGHKPYLGLFVLPTTHISFC